MFWTHMNIAIVCFCTVCTVCTVCTTSVWCGFFFCIESEKSRKVYWFVFWLEMIILICVLAGNDNIYAFDKAFSLVAVQQCQRCSVVLRFCSWFYLTSHWNYPLWHTAIYLLPAMTYCISIHYPLRHTVYLFITRYDILYIHYPLWHTIYSLPSMTHCISIHYPLSHTVYLFFACYDVLFVYSLLKNWLIAVPFMNKEVNFR